MRHQIRDRFSVGGYRQVTKDTGVEDCAHPPSHPAAVAQVLIIISDLSLAFASLEECHRMNGRCQSGAGRVERCV